MNAGDLFTSSAFPQCILLMDSKAFQTSLLIACISLSSFAFATPSLTIRIFRNVSGRNKERMNRELREEKLN